MTLRAQPHELDMRYAFVLSALITANLSPICVKRDNRSIGYTTHPVGYRQTRDHNSFVAHLNAIFHLRLGCAVRRWCMKAVVAQLDTCNVICPLLRARHDHVFFERITGVCRCVLRDATIDTCVSRRRRFSLWPHHTNCRHNVCKTTAVVAGNR